MRFAMCCLFSMLSSDQGSSDPFLLYAHVQLLSIIYRTGYRLMEMRRYTFMVLDKRIHK